MSYKLGLFFVLFQLASLFAQEQNIPAKQLASQQMDIDVFVGFDTTGDLYYIKNNVFYRKNDKELWQYKNVSLGKITKIDFQNQLKIMLYYENFNTIILLDNQLNETQKINFSENEFPILVAASGIASQNRLWIYNSLTQQIGLYDFLKNSFQSITPSLEGNVKYYESDFNTFRWIDDKMNGYAVDVFGKITTINKVRDFDQIQLISNQDVVFSKDGNLFFQDAKKNRIYSIENVDKSFKKFYYKDQILAIFTDQGITNYKITIP
ncbi:hypothetical protein [Flavobacterium nackdongense]|uniref:Uncharacterized protein n=1 Tax=Flavobacterium nackdongense TaxID=2547394 RepID=A0A4P6YFI9_9FLAO|nr:hypothetical protein [Flavobacterium nackdongense]QBN19674.1 hypothetical protein E1750_12965 [Flavobacterium nackdongense]